MKTVFKVGMEVYDYIYGKGEVIEVQNYQYVDNILLVKFSNRKEPIKYSLDGRLINYKTCGGDLDSENIATNPTLSTSPYTLQGFEQKAPAPTYEEAVEWLEKNSKDRVIYADEAYISEEYELAFEALKKLTILRDYYNEGWEPDFLGKNDWRFCIITHCNRLAKDTTFSDCRVMTFKTEQIRDKFLEEQKELLEIAKPLL